MVLYHNFVFAYVFIGSLIRFYCVHESVTPEGFKFYLLWGFLLYDIIRTDNTNFAKITSSVIQETYTFLEMKGEKTMGKAIVKTQKKENLMQNIVTEDSISALGSAMDIVKREYGDFKITKEMRQVLATELGETEEYVDNWQKVVDILDHIDINELAKKHPEKIGMVSKTIVGIITCIYPAAAVATIIPEDFLAKTVEFAGILTPEHLINILAKKQVEKNKAKREMGLDADKPFKFSELKGKLASGYKQTTDKLSGLLPKKSSVPEEDQKEDIFDSIRKLSQLKESGIITQEEFDAKKTELLSKI